MATFSGRSSIDEVKKRISGAQIGQAVDRGEPITGEESGLGDAESAFIDEGLEGVDGEVMRGGGLVPWEREDLIEGRGAVADAVPAIDPEAVIDKADGEVAADAQSGREGCVGIL